MQKIIKPHLTKLLDHQRDGYVFHGSNDPDIEILTPRQTHDLSATEGFTIDVAVFATPLPEAGIIFAVMDTSRVPKDLGGGIWGVNSDEEGGIFAEIPEKWRECLENSGGVVYVLPGEPFEGEGMHEGWQVKSHVPVKPIDKIEVSFEDFEIMGGRIKWT